MNLQLLNLLEKVYGKHQSVSNGNYYFYSPFMKHHKPKLCVKLSPDKSGNYKWNCWVSSNGGYNIFSLFAKTNVDYRYFEELRTIISSSRSYTPYSPNQNTKKVTLPFGFKHLSDGISTYKESKIVSYLLKNRGITESDIIRYKIGHSDIGIYDNMVIVPSYNSEYKLNYYYARSTIKTKDIVHKKPDGIDECIVFENTLSTKHPLILCEGMFDSISIKQNSTPLMGKNISDVMVNYILDNNITSIIMCLDPDAIKNTIGYINMLMSFGINMYFCDLGDKDPSEHGYDEMKLRVESSRLITKPDLIKLKVKYAS